MTEKTLGQIAHETGELVGNWQRRWSNMTTGHRAEWEAIAEAVIDASGLRQQLSAAQAMEKQLLDAIDLAISKVEGGWSLEAQEILEEAIAIPTDTTALQAIIQRSGEVMRDRIVANLLQCGALAEGDYLNAIRALPSVTLEDLR